MILYMEHLWHIFWYWVLSDYLWKICNIVHAHYVDVVLFRLSISAVVMSYLQNPQPMSMPWWHHTALYKCHFLTYQALIYVSY